MTKVASLKTAVDVTRRREDNLACTVVTDRGRVEQERQRLSQLESYREDYRRAFLERAGEGISAALLRQYQTLLGSLDQAIQQQQGRVDQADACLQDHQADWDATRAKRLGIDRVVSRLEAGEKRSAERREQSENDELAQQLRWGAISRGSRA